MLMLMLVLHKDTKQPSSPQQPDANGGDGSQNTNKGFGGMSAKDFQDRLERLKNNVRAEVPDCNCFPPDKCKNISIFPMFGPLILGLIEFMAAKMLSQESGVRDVTQLGEGRTSLSLNS